MDETGKMKFAELGWEEKRREEEATKEEQREVDE